MHIARCRCIRYVGDGMRLLPIVLLLAGCGSFENYEYGPGDWLVEQFPSTHSFINNPYNYERLQDPEIIIHVVDNLGKACGTSKALGCMVTDTITCDIYVGERSAQSTIAHEIRHCYGWSHGDIKTAWYKTGAGRNE